MGSSVSRPCATGGQEGPACVQGGAYGRHGLATQCGVGSMREARRTPQARPSCSCSPAPLPPLDQGSWKNNSKNYCERLVRDRGWWAAGVRCGCRGPGGQGGFSRVSTFKAAPPPPPPTPHHPHPPGPLLPQRRPQELEKGTASAIDAGFEAAMARAEALPPAQRGHRKGFLKHLLRTNPDRFLK